MSVTRFWWREATSRCQGVDPSSCPSADGLPGNPSAWLTRASHDRGQWRAPRSDPATQPYRNQDTIQYSEEHRPSSRHERRRAFAGNRSIVSRHLEWTTRNGSVSLDHRCQAPLRQRSRTFASSASSATISPFSTRSVNDSSASPGQGPPTHTPSSIRNKAP